MIEEESDDDDILNENVSDNIKIKAMEKAHAILSKSKTSAFHKTHLNNSASWLISTIKNIIKTSDKIISPHKYTFKNYSYAYDCSSTPPDFFLYTIVNQSYYDNMHIAETARKRQSFIP